MFGVMGLGSLRCLNRRSLCGFRLWGLGFSGLGFGVLRIRSKLVWWVWYYGIGSKMPTCPMVPIFQGIETFSHYAKQAFIILFSYDSKILCTPPPTTSRTSYCWFCAVAGEEATWHRPQDRQSLMLVILVPFPPWKAREVAQQLGCAS